MTYYLRFYASGREIQAFFAPDWYGLSDAEIQRVAQGVCAGMYCKYKHPSVEVWEMTLRGSELRHRIN